VPTVDDFRRLALDLPETEEKAHMGHPDFRVRNRIFAALRPDDGVGVVKTTREEMEALVEATPAVYEARPWGPTSWLRIWLDGADIDEVADLVAEAWSMVAPKRVVAAYVASRGGDG
jgi:hypothetical protein